MKNSLLRTDKEIVQIYNRHVNTVYKICYMYLKNKYDAEDATQTVFIKLINYKKQFENEEHEKAWLIVTASNTCKNNLKYWWHKVTKMESLDEVANLSKEDKTLSKILKLPNKYKLIIYMHYYEGYKTNEIALKLNMNDSTVRSYLKRGRNMLKQMIKEENNE